MTADLRAQIKRSRELQSREAEIVDDLRELHIYVQGNRDELMLCIDAADLIELFIRQREQLHKDICEDQDRAQKDNHAAYAQGHEQGLKDGGEGR